MTNITPSTVRSTAVATIVIPRELTAATFRDVIETNWGADLARIAAPKFERPAARLAAGLQQALLTSPGLLDCDPKTIFLALAKCARLGLDIGESGMYLVPNKKSFTKRDGTKSEIQSCEAWADYRGLKVLARRSGLILDMREYLIYEGDEFNYTLGVNPTLDHRPGPASKRGKILFAYTVIERRGRQNSFHIMPIEDIEAIRAKSRGWGPKSPQGSALPIAWYCKKTVVKDYLNKQPKTGEMADALEEALEADDIQSPLLAEGIAVGNAEDEGTPAIAGVVSEPDAGEAATPEQLRELVRLLKSDTLTAEERTEYMNRADALTMDQMGETLAMLTVLIAQRDAKRGTR